MHISPKVLYATLIALLLILMIALGVSAVSGAGYTTFNAHVDGASKDVCKNSAVNCNIYGAKEYVWLNGGPTANGLGPNGQYFFAVLAPSGQQNPNDGSAQNLSDDFDTYANRTFTVTNGEVSAYGGTHWLDDGKSGPKPNGKPPYIRLFPYADTPNPGGVYIMAICSLQNGYPVAPRSCKYDAFKVAKKMEYSFYLAGMKFEDTYADGVKDPVSVDPGLSGWKILISGTGPDGLPFTGTAVTGANGNWDWNSPSYTFTGSQKPGDVTVKVCEEPQTGWTQSFPGGDGCHTFTFTPTGFNSFFPLDFGNWRPVSVTGCKVRDMDGVAGGTTVPVPGWPVSLIKNGAVVDTQLTLADGCYTWTGLTPGFTYGVSEGSQTGWKPLGATSNTFERAKSGKSYTFTFVNAVLQGCTPGFWQGGSDGGQAGGKWLWDEVQDPQWPASGGKGWNPYIWTTPFNGFFTPYGALDGFDMMTLVGTGGGPDDYQKAARDLVAAYLNSSWGMYYKYSTGTLSQMWAEAVASGDFLSLHYKLDAANNSQADTNGDGVTEHQCPISASGY